MRRLSTALFLAAVTVPSVASGQQQLRVALKVGSSGVGADVVYGLNGFFDVRGGLAFFPYEREYEFDDLAYDVTFPSPNGTVLLDFYPSGRLVRLSGGLFFSFSDYSFEETIIASTEIGDVVYLPTDIAQLEGEVKNSDLAPYLGIGFGDTRGPGIGFLLDVGFAFRNSPEVTLLSRGELRKDPGFLAQLEKERRRIQDDLSSLPFNIYPVIAVGFRLGV